MKYLIALLPLILISCAPTPWDDLGSSLKDKSSLNTKTLNPVKNSYILQRDGSFYEVTGSKEVFTLNQ